MTGLPAWFGLLTEVAGSRDMPMYWQSTQKLLQAIAPHGTAVVWNDLSVTILGDAGERRRQQVLDALSAHWDEVGVEQEFSAGFLAYTSVASLAGNALLTALDEPPPQRVQVWALDRLRGSDESFSRILDSIGWKHALLLPLCDKGEKLSAGIVLYRTQEEGEFDVAQVACIDGLHALLSSVFMRLTEYERQRGTQANILGILSDLPVGLVLLDWDWRPLFANEEGYRQTQLWNHAPAIPPAGDARLDFRLPQALCDAGDRLRTRWVQDALGVTTPAKGELNERVTHALRKDMKATVSISVSKDGNKRLPGLVVRYSGMAMRTASGFQPTPVQLSILSQLTPGERNVALLIMRGMSNQEIADALHRDVTTVKDHLSHIYDKLGIRNRTQLAAQLAG